MTRLAVTILALSMVQCEWQRKPDPPQASASVAASASGPQPATSSVSGRAKRARPKAPKGFVEVTAKTVIPTTHGNAVMLVEPAANRALLIFVGDTEALSIHLRLEGEHYARPLTHDLFDDVLDGLNARVHAVRVDRLDNEVFYGVVSIESGGKLRDYDSRTSDAIAMALGNHAPIFVASDVMKRASVELDAEGMPSASASAPAGAGKAPISL